MLKRWILLVGLSLLGSQAAQANDSAVVGEGGRWKRMQEGSTSIQMVREKILLSLDQKDSFSVVADFTFKNHGKATAVKMGFPESGGGDISATDFGKKSGFKSFSSTVDGQKMAVTRQSTHSEDEMQYTAFWVKTVPFKAGQTRKVQVRYRSPYGGRTAYINWFATYDFTGGNWWGKVQESILTVRLSRPGAYIVGSDKTKPKPAFVRKGQDFIYTWKNWQAEESFIFPFTPTMTDWLAWKERDPRQENGFAVKIPGKASETDIGFMPSGVYKNGKTFVNLRGWVDHIEGAEIKTAPGGVSVHYKGKTATYSTKSPTPDSFVAQGKYTTSALFVSAARLNRDFGVKFASDVKAHRLSIVP